MSGLHLSLLDHSQDDRMAKSVDSGDWREVSVQIENGNRVQLPLDQGSASGKVSTGEQVQLQAKTGSSGQQTRQRLEDVFTSASVASSWRNSRGVRTAAQSRLMDPPASLLRECNRDEDYMDEDMPEEYMNNKCSALTVAEWVSLVLVIVALICSLSIPSLKKQSLWDLVLWKWEVMGMAIICGGLVSGWAVRVSVRFMEHSFLLRKRVLYFVYGLRKAVRNCLWLVLVLIAWECVFYKKFEMETHSKALAYVTKILVCLLVASFLWLVKTVLVKALASSFHMSAFFEKIQQSLIEQDVVKKLLSAKVEKPYNFRADIWGNFVPTTTGSPRQHDEMSIDGLDKMNRKNVSAWSMKKMVDMIHYKGLSTLDELILNSDIGDEFPLQGKSGCLASKTTEKIFDNVTGLDPQYIHLEDLMHFMGESDAKKTMECIGGAAECNKISKQTLKNWMVNVIKERRKLAASLNDTKTAVDDLHRMLDVFVAVIIAIIWLLILDVQITHFLLFISSQLLVVVFVFGNTCRTTFEAIIFLFVMHPYDVGDRCEIDGIQMVVEEMNILTTVFLRPDNQMIIYPNSVLAAKPISNYNRSPDMGESVDFCIHISTPVNKIAALKQRIKRYIESRSDHWHPEAMIIIKDVEHMNKLTMEVYVTHTMNLQNMGERLIRRALLVEEIIKVSRELEIEYRMLPLEVNIRNIPGFLSQAPF